MITTLRLPALFALDWFERLGEQLGARVIRSNTRFAYLELPPEALSDLRDDARYCVEFRGEFDPDSPYPSAAARVLNVLDR